MSRSLRIPIPNNVARAELGYDPGRVVAVDNKTSAAIVALRSITSVDPSAQTAMSAVRGLLTTLETGWVPAIQAVRASDALTGGGAVSGLGGGGSGPSWGFDALHIGGFCPLDPLAALFPGDDDITAADIVAKIDESLGQRPSREQFSDLVTLGRALDEIAEDPDLAAEVLAELGPEGLQNVYTELFMLGLAYPFVPDNPDDASDRRMIGGHLDLTVGNPFNRLVAAGSSSPDGRRVIGETIDLAADADNAWDLAALGGLVRVEGLPPNLARRLFEAVDQLDPYMFTSFMDRDNSMYPELEYDVADLRLFVIANNPILIHDLIHDHGEFVDGGEELLAELIESNGYYWRTDQEIGELLSKIFGHIIEFTPDSQLIERRTDGGPGSTGVVFDLVDLLLDNDLKVPGHHVLAAIGPHLPEIIGSVPGSSSPYSAQDVRAILEDLFEDLSPAQTEEALQIIVASAIAKVPITITSADFDGTEPAGIAVGDLLDSLFGPVVGALDDIVKDDEEQAAFWRAAINDAFGLIPIPGSSVAKFAIKRGVREIVDALPLERDSPDAAVDAAQQALIENTVTVLYADPAINAQVVEQALADWDRTAILLGGEPGESTPGGHELNRVEVDRIRRELEHARDNGTLVDPDVFVRLPQIVDLVEELQDELTLSPARNQSG